VTDEPKPLTDEELDWIERDDREASTQGCESIVHGDFAQRLVADVRRARAACTAAIAYDAAIQRAAHLGKSWVGGNEGSDNLDALYADWIDKARGALPRVQ
jgi:hypothetical protein